jgi:putative membrane protein
MEKADDDVSNIHNRFSLTLINPSSHYFSLIVSLLVATAITSIAHLIYLGSDELWFRIPAVVATLGVIQLIDTKFTKRKEYSKSLHASLFGNLIWCHTNKGIVVVFHHFWYVSICKF